jgi:sulfite oxidase
MWAWTLWEANVPVPVEAKESDTVEVRAPLARALSLVDFNLEEDSLFVWRGVAWQLICKATDSSYNDQPESAAPIWNLRGVLMHSWHRVTLRKEESLDSDAPQQ